MSLRIRTTGIVKDGSLTLRHRKYFEEALSKVQGPVTVTVERETRRERQNALYWVWNTIVGDELGMTPEEVHELNKMESNAGHVSWHNKKTGEIHDKSTPKSTASLSVDAFSEFMERCQRFWAEQGILLPDSDQGG